MFRIGVCKANLCRNGGFCRPKGASYECTCKSGYFGNNCEAGLLMDCQLSCHITRYILVRCIFYNTRIR